MLLDFDALYLIRIRVPFCVWNSNPYASSWLSSQLIAEEKELRVHEYVEALFCGVWLRICQSWKFLQISASYDQFSMYINFSHALQQLWTVLVNFGELLENCVFKPNYYFQHSYATSACFGHPGTILDSFGQFWTTFGKLRF